VNSSLDFVKSDPACNFDTALVKPIFCATISH
jgi:hypothetical protein